MSLQEWGTIHHLFHKERKRCYGIGLTLSLGEGGQSKACQHNGPECELLKDWSNRKTGILGLLMPFCIGGLEHFCSMRMESGEKSSVTAIFFQI